MVVRRRAGELEKCEGRELANESRLDPIARFWKKQLVESVRPGRIPGS